MAPEVVLRKLEQLRRLLVDIEPLIAADREQIEREHYEVERILELLATAAADLLQHLLAERGVLADSYRDVFRQAATADIVEGDLARRLEDAAGIRNILVHLYDDIDLEIVRASLPGAFTDFSALVAALAPFAEE
jgi:uncharacterized protein YutE (UPF0331/DUF86 family)